MRSLPNIVLRLVSWIWIIVRVLLGGSPGVQFCKLFSAGWFFVFFYMYLADPPNGIPPLADSYAVANFTDPPSTSSPRVKRLYYVIDGVKYLSIAPRGRLSPEQERQLEGKTVRISWMQVERFQGPDQLLYVYRLEGDNHLFWTEEDYADFIRDTKGTKWKNFALALLVWGLLCAHSAGQIRSEIKSRGLTNP